METLTEIRFGTDSVKSAAYPREVPGLLNLAAVANRNPCNPLHAIHNMAGLDPNWTFGPAYWIENPERSYWRFSRADLWKQRRVHDALSAAYGPVFLPACLGYRKGVSRPVARAVAEIRAALDTAPDPVLIRADIADCFESIPCNTLHAMIRERVSDGVVLRLLRRFLDQPRHGPRARGRGVFLGSVLGPVLCNIYLHTVIDSWIAGAFPGVACVRYADDLACVPMDGTTRPTALLEALRARLRAFGLTLNPDKTTIAHPGQSAHFLKQRIRVPFGTLNP